MTPLLGLSIQDLDQVLFVDLLGGLHENTLDLVRDFVNELALLLLKLQLPLLHHLYHVQAVGTLCALKVVLCR